MDQRPAVINAPNTAHSLATRVFAGEGARKWLSCSRCGVAWPITWGYTHLEPCLASGWGR